jgi:arylsulfatase A-like enzyme
VAAILNEINGFEHNGTTPADTPALFGMNFQAVSVGQKLRSEQLPPTPPPLPTDPPPPVASGGYVNVDGEFVPSDGLQATLDHTDQSIGAMVSALSARRLLDSTLIIISAKHGNSPIDPATFHAVNPATISTIVNTVPPGLALLSADTGPLIWLKDQSTTAAVVAALNASITTGGNPASIATIISGEPLTALFPDPLTDSRTPDIVLQPKPGTVYTTSLTKIADHGGFGDDDVHVALLVSNSLLPQKTINDQVETRQIACTILKAFNLDCGALDSQNVDPSKFLPHSNHDWAYDKPAGPQGRKNR